MHGRTTFIIAHRLSTLRHCDVLLLLEDGGVRIIRREDAELESLLHQAGPATTGIRDAQAEVAALSAQLPG